MKRIPCRIEMTEELCEITVLSSDMYRTYMLLNLLAEGELNEICFFDIACRQKTSVRRSADGANTLGADGVFLTDNAIACIKQLIVQCHLHPQDAAWLHYDLEIAAPDGHEMSLYIHLSRSSVSS